MNEYSEWFNKALKDLDTAKYNINGKRLDAGAFFLQQSAEKALKATILKKSKELIKTHDLVALAKKANASQDIIDKCKKLSPAYGYTRYPDIPKPEELDDKINELLSIAEDIIKWVKKNL